MGKGMRLLAGSVSLLAASGLIAALWIHSPDASHRVAWDSFPPSPASSPLTVGPVDNDGHAVLAVEQ